jgi:hypothetical protein
MSGMAVKDDIETPQSLWAELNEMNGRILLTIPFGATQEDMQGFISIVGESSAEEDTLPVMTFCIAKPSGGIIISTIVYQGGRQYLDFVDRIYTDAYCNFEKLPKLIN